ncbi:MAG: amidase family protein, partial [Rhodospirillales bacterium]|nr:amidase family protein [Rhodospirillales bacterium]
VPEVADICGAAAARFAELGCEVAEACPDFSGAPETFQTLRAGGYAAGVGRLLAEHRDELKPEVVWNIEKGLKLTAQEIGMAELARGALIRRMGEFFQEYDLLACPVTQVPPFDVEMRYMDEINGQKMESYIDWFAITFALTLTGCPAISLPCGFTEAGLPVGLQLIGPRRGEGMLLSAAAAAEEMLDLAGLLPIDPRERAGV